MAGNQDFLESVNAAARAEGAALKAMLLGMERIDQIFEEARPKLPDCLREEPAAPAPKVTFGYSPEPQAAMDREYAGWLRSARPGDSDWGLTHASDWERVR